MPKEAPTPESVPRFDISDFSQFDLRHPEDGGEPYVVASNEAGSRHRLMTDAEILSSYGRDPTMADRKQHIRDTLSAAGADEEPAGDTEPVKADSITDTVFIDQAPWRHSRRKRDEAPKKYMPRPHYRHGAPYPGAPEVFEPIGPIEQPDYPIGGIYTTGEGDDAVSHEATIVGNPGSSIDGKSYVRTKEHDVVPAEQVKTLESELGIDTTRFVLAGIGPALYWKKVNVMARDSDNSPSVFRTLLSKFTESHPGIKAVGEAVAMIKEEFDRDHPQLSGVLSVGTSALKSVGSFLAKDPENSGMYNFKQAAERDMQSGRAFYMARPSHLSIWFKSHNYDGTINPKRREELRRMRKDGWALQSEISTRSIWGSILHPNSLYRRELNEFLASTPGSLGYRAVKFANIQHIANIQQRDRTHRQWAVSLINGRNLTQREREDLRQYVQDRKAYVRDGVSPQPQPLTVELSDKLALAG